MFYKDKNDIQIIIFGVGSVIVANTKLPDGPPVVYLAEGSSDKIGVDVADLKGKTDTEIGTKVKMVFSNIESIDILIDRLVKAKGMLDAPEDNN